MKNILTFFLLSMLLSLHAQEYSSSNIHSHNDYANALPFYESYANQVGSVEADVYGVNNELFVAHTTSEIKPVNTLKKMYLEPLASKIKALNGTVYANNKPLVLMIDIKTDATTTLNILLKQLYLYPEITSNSNLKIVISGNVPEPSLWEQYPDFIHFDARIGKIYSSEQLARIEMISDDLKNYTVWNGKGVLTKPDLEKLQSLIKTVHSQNKKIRFWATNDNVNTWITLMNLGADYIATDKITDLTKFIGNRKKFSYQNTEFYKPYTPKNKEGFLKNIPPKNIILLIGDGMGLTQIYAGCTANKGQLNMFNIPTQGLSITNASDSYITDSAAGATAMATGFKSNNRFLGMGPDGKPLESIVQKLAKKNYQTAIISSGNATDATPAAFYAHQIDRSYNEAIALDFVLNPCDVFIGGGLEEFTKRKDSQNLALVLKQNGYDFSSQFSDLGTIQNPRFVVLDNASVVSKKEGRGDFLERALVKTCHTFAKSSKPFFIMEEGAQIDYGGHKNDMEYVVRELLDFDKAVGLAMEFVDHNKETLLIVTADHETGGLSLIDGSVEQGYVHGNFSTDDHTAVPVPVFAYGPGAEKFKGVYQNTAIYDKIIELLFKK